MTPLRKGPTVSDHTAPDPFPDDLSGLSDERFVHELARLIAADLHRLRPEDRLIACQDLIDLRMWTCQQARATLAVAA
jgi:hypothetical protein